MLFTPEELPGIGIREEHFRSWEPLIQSGNQIALLTLYKYIGKEAYQECEAGTASAEFQACIKLVEMNLTAWQMIIIDDRDRDSIVSQRVRTVSVKHQERNAGSFYDTAMNLLSLLGYDVFSTFRMNEE
jgi:hypothetical protein